MKQDTKPINARQTLARECHQKFKLQVCVVYLKNVQSYAIAPSASSELPTTDFITFHIMMVIWGQLFSQCVRWNITFFHMAWEKNVPH